MQCKCYAEAQHRNKMTVSKTAQECGLGILYDTPLKQSLLLFQDKQHWNTVYCET